MCCRLSAFKDKDLIGLHCSCWRVDRCGPVHRTCHPDADPGADGATRHSLTARQRYSAKCTRSSGVSPYINGWRPSIRFMPPCGQTSTSAVTPRSRARWSIVHGLATLAIDNQLASLVSSESRERAERLEVILGTPCLCSRTQAAETGKGDAKYQRRSTRLNPGH